MKKRTLAFILALTLVPLGLVSCKKEANDKTAEKHIYESMVDGKLFSISYIPERDEAESTVILKDEELAEIDKKAEDALVAMLSFLSAEHNASIADINKQVDYIFGADAEVVDYMKRVYEMSDATGGAYKPVIADAEDYSCSSIIEIGEDKLIKHDRAAKIDLMGISESYALDYAAASLKASNIKEAVLKYGKTVLRFDLKDEMTSIKADLYFADGNNEADARITLEKGYLTTYNKDDKFIDAVTGSEMEPLHNTLVVISENYYIASCFAETFMTMETDVILELYSKGTYLFEVIIVENDMNVVTTKGVTEKGLLSLETETAE